MRMPTRGGVGDGVGDGVGLANVNPCTSTHSHVHINCPEVTGPGGGATRVHWYSVKFPNSTLSVTHGGAAVGSSNVT